MRIQSKLFVTIVVSSLLLTTSIVVLVQWSLDREMLTYVNSRLIDSHMPLVEELAERHRRDQWNALRDNPFRFDNLLRSYAPGRMEGRGAPPGPGPRGQPGGYRDGPKHRFGDGPGDGKRDGRREGPTDLPPHKRKGREGAPGKRSGPGLFDADGLLVAGSARTMDDSTEIPVVSGNQTVGYLRIPKIQDLSEDYDLQFREQQSTALVVIGLVVVGLSAMFALLVAPTIVRPIKQIASTAGKMTQGDYDQMLSEARNDELGELSRDVNELARALKQAEKTRQRWLADTSHELRTPLAIIKGEIEAMLDGIRQMDRNQLSSLKNEVDHLQKLIDDLTDLSNADIGSLRYHKQWVDMNELIDRRRVHYEELCADNQLTLTVVKRSGRVELYADEQRFTQLLDNLVNNSCKYTDSGGRVVIEVSSEEIIVEDSAPGVPEDALDYLFDHLYRVDSSRNRRTGGSGLGLAIASRIAEGHDCTIEALHSDLGGVRIRIGLPEQE